MLAEGKPNSLGRTEEVVDEVVADRRKLRSLYACYRSDDEWVRLRVSSSLKRVFRDKPEWFSAWADRIIDEVAAIDQPSAQWTAAQVLEEHAAALDEAQTARAKRVVQGLLSSRDDCIVINCAMSALGSWADHDARLRKRLVPQLRTFSEDRRKSIAGRARKLLARLDGVAGS